MYLMRQIGRDGSYQSDLPGLHGVPRLEIPALVLGVHRQLPGRAVPGRRGARAAGLVFGYFAFRSRIKGVYFSIITQALTYAAMLLFFRNETGFGGNNGFTDFKRIPGIRSPRRKPRRHLFGPVRLLLLFASLLGRYLMTSKFGRMLTAIRDAESARHVPRLQPAVVQALHLDPVAVLRPSPARCTCRRWASSTRRDVAGQLIEIAIWSPVGGAAPGRAGDRRGYRQPVQELLHHQAFPEYWLFFLGLLFMLVTLYLPQGVVGCGPQGAMARRPPSPVPGRGAALAPAPSGCRFDTPATAAKGA